MTTSEKGSQADVAGSWTWPLTPARTRAILDGTPLYGVRSLALLDAGERVLMRVYMPPRRDPKADDADAADDAVVEAGASVDVGGRPVALVRVEGSPARTNAAALEDAARLVAARLADAWSAAQEMESMSGEILRSYDELHLLYDLAEALTGQLSVMQVTDFILTKILDVVPAGRAELRLDSGEAPTHVRIAPHQPRHGSARAWIAVDSADGQGVAPSSALEDRDQRLCTTLCTGEHTIGTVVLVRPSGGTPFSSNEAKLLDAVGSFAATAIRNAQLRQQVDTDALTGLPNHRGLQEQLDAHLDAAHAEAQPLGVLMIDIDDFKLFNDTYGHLAGDDILRLTAEALSNVCRDAVIGRYGGDEFVAILPRTDRAGAMLAAERLLARMAERELTLAGQEALTVSISIGCAHYPEDGASRRDLLTAASAALNDTKHRGGGGVRSLRTTSADIAAPLDTSTTFTVLQGLVNAVDAKDRYTGEHSRVVAEAAVLLARRLGLSQDACRALHIAGLLHDVGKIGIPDHILRKPGRLTPPEYAVMRHHVVLSELIVKDVPHLAEVRDAIAQHHERYDGTGYPRGLRGPDISLLGRIMVLADAWSAMTVNRPYRKGLGQAQAIVELRRGAGQAFDPALVEPFVACIAVAAEQPAPASEPRQYRYGGR